MDAQGCLHAGGHDDIDKGMIQVPIRVWEGEIEKCPLCIRSSRHTLSKAILDSNKCHNEGIQT